MPLHKLWLIQEISEIELPFYPLQTPGKGIGMPHQDQDVRVEILGQPFRGKNTDGILDKRSEAQGRGAEMFFDTPKDGP